MQKIANNSFFDTLEQVTSSIDVSNLADVFRFISFSPSQRYETHNHKRIEINFVKRGSCIIQLDNESISFKRNEMMIICTDVPHAFEAGTSGCALMQLEFLPNILSNFALNQKVINGNMMALEIFSSKNRLIKIVDNIRINRSVERIVSEMNGKDSYFQHLVVMYYTELLVLIHRYINDSYLPINRSETLKKAIEYIQHNYTKDITIDQVAKISGVSDSYLRRLFTKHLNISPINYYNQIRINKSIELLRTTDLSIKEVCFRCGFKSPQYFSKVFKNQVGSKPSDLLKNKISSI